MPRSIMFHQGSRELQDAFDSRRISDRLEEKLTRTAFTADDTAFLGRVIYFFMATADADGRPSVRIVLLKAHGPDGFIFYTNERSRKDDELAANPRAALLFYWIELEREVRIEGAIEKVSAQESDEYFASRPLGSRLAAISSTQSATVASRAVLEEQYAQAERRHGEAPQCPEVWGGYRVVPDAVEFWQGRPNRLHDRILYTRQADGTWTRQRLSP